VKALSPSGREQLDGRESGHTCMTLDEQIKHAFDALTDRLRDEMSRQVESTIDELSTSVRAERDEAVAAARAEAERTAGESLIAAVAEAATRARESARDEFERLQLERDERDRERREQEARERDARDQEQRAREQERAMESIDPQAVAAAAVARLADAFRAIDRARSLTEILDTLVNCAGREATRAGVWLVREGSFRGWRFTGFEAGFDGSPAFEAAAEEGSVLAAALRNAEQAGGSAATGAAPSFANLPHDSEAVAVPITMNGQVVAVLYADRGLSDDESGKADQGRPRQLPTDTIELLARHTARCLEALTAFKAARALLDRPGAESAPVEPAAGDEASGDEDASARRYARLIVSEIKLYHEAAVIAGRRERDLAARLAGEIARAQALYEQRVPAHLRDRTDYFHHELVRTLANGDASLLDLGSLKSEV
jgi:hypothetical protein